jgi:hypothetical protein
MTGKGQEQRKSAVSVKFQFLKLRFHIVVEATTCPLLAMNRSASGSLPTNGELPVLNSTCERRWDISMQRTHLDRL